MKDHILLQQRKYHLLGFFLTWMEQLSIPQKLLRSIGTSKRPSHLEPHQPLTKRRIGSEIGVDPNVILQTSHGRRSIDVLKIISPEKANWDCMFPLSCD